MNYENPILTTVSSSSTFLPKLWRNLISATVFVALVAPAILEWTWFRPQARTNTPSTPRVEWSAQVEKILSELMRANDEAADAESKVWEAFGHQLKALQEQDRQETQAGVKSAVNSLVQVDQVGWLIADFAQDKVRGGERGANRVKACSSSFIQALKDSALRSSNLIDGLQQELTAVNNRYAMQVGEIIQAEGTQLPRTSFEQLAAVQQNMPMRVMTQIGSATVAVAFEAATVRATRESMTKLLELLGKKLAPQIGKATIGVGAAVVDGPLPVGDILAVGLAVWTVWDVVSLPNQIRSDVREEFSRVAEGHLATLDAKVQSAVRELSTQPRRAREKLHQEVLARLAMNSK